MIRPLTREVYIIYQNEMATTDKPYVDMSRTEIEATEQQGKHGSAEDGTDGAHKMSHELLKGTIQNTPGPNPTVTTPEIIHEVQSPENIRIKSSEGNRVTDHENDSSILAKETTGERLTKEEGQRAAQAYKGVGYDNPTVAHAKDRIGDMTVSTGGRPGRPPMVKNI